MNAEGLSYCKATDGEDRIGSVLAVPAPVLSPGQSGLKSRGAYNYHFLILTKFTQRKCHQINNGFSRSSKMSPKDKKGDIIHSEKGQTSKEHRHLQRYRFQKNKSGRR